MDELTKDLLLQAGFEIIGRDKVCEKYELRTKWQTIHIWHNYVAPCSPFRVGGIIHTDDRATVRTTGQLFDAVCLFGADQTTREYFFKHLIGEV
jgi:hypothetical protein